MKRKGLVKVRVRGRKRDGSGIEKGDKGRVRGRVKGRGEGEGRKGGKLGTWRVEVEVEVEVRGSDGSVLTDEVTGVLSCDVQVSTKPESGVRRGEVRT